MLAGTRALAQDLRAERQGTNLRRIQAIEATLAQLTALRDATRAALSPEAEQLVADLMYQIETLAGAIVRELKGRAHNHPEP